MPVALTERLEPPAPLIPPRKHWTREECTVLAETGVLDYDHIELIHGELIQKMPKKRPHSIGLLHLLYWLIDTFGQERVTPESSIDVSPEDNPTNEPEPDIVVLNSEGSSFQPTAIQPNQIALVVEISDSTLHFDLTVKAALYARAGIPEYWVLDLNGRRLIVHRDPQAGVYRSVVSYSETERVAPLAAPDRELPVSQVLG